MGARKDILPTRRRAAFTLVELLVVIVVIGILAGILLPVLLTAKRSARMTACKSNLREFMHAVVMFRQNNEDAYPPWLSALYPAYISSEDGYICPQDAHRGAQGSRPDWLMVYVDDFSETNDIAGQSGSASELRKEAIEACSYMYEFGAMECSLDVPPPEDWMNRDGDPEISWCEYKTAVDVKGRRRHGDEIVVEEDKAYNGHVPMIRCFYHVSKATNTLYEEPVLNVSCGNHNVYECEFRADGWKAVAP
jgi:prepilin-type N-terminal cleavage/methylation domain-containing protein